MLFAELTAASTGRVLDSTEQVAYRCRIEALPAREQRRLRQAVLCWQDDQGRSAGPSPSDDAEGMSTSPAPLTAPAVFVGAIVAEHQEQAADDFVAGEIESFLTAPLTPSADPIELVVRNAGQLRARGLYERALVYAYRLVQPVHWPRDTLHLLFELCRPDALRACGDAIPSGGPFTVYRGGGAGAALSWSSDPLVAAFFASRSRARVVQRVTLAAQDVAAYFRQAAVGVRLPWVTDQSDEFLTLARPGGVALEDDEAEGLIARVS